MGNNRFGKYFLFFLFFLLLFFVACTKAEVYFLVDEKYYESVEAVASPFKALSLACREKGIKAKMEKVVVTHLEPDFTTKIQEQKQATLIVLSPYLAKKASTYAQAMPDRFFVKIETLGKAEGENIFCLYRFREPFFKELAEDVYQYQKRGLKIGAAFYIGESRRNQEKILFFSHLQSLNQNNYAVIEVPIYKVDNLRNAKEISSTMFREEVDYLLLFCSTLNYEVMEDIPLSSKIKVITESLYPQDQIYKDRVYYSINNDYEVAFKNLIDIYLQHKKEGKIPSEKRDIALPVKRFYLGDPIEVEEPEEDEHETEQTVVDGDAEGGEEASAVESTDTEKPHSSKEEE